MSDEPSASAQQRDELEREKLQEEIKQLRAAARMKWITPAALASLLPLLAGFGVWIAGELKQYNEAYTALAERDKLRAEKDALQSQKDSLNLEVQTLLQLKSHYATEAEKLRQDTERKQATIDQTFLRGVFTRAEAMYSLDHIKGMGPPPDIEEVRKELGKHALPDELSKAVNDILGRYDFALTVINMSRGIVSEFNKSVNRSWLAFRFFNVDSFVYNSRCANVNSVGPPTRLPWAFCLTILADFHCSFESVGTWIAGWYNDAMIRAYDEIVEFIAAGTTPDTVARFEPSQQTKDYVADLIHKEKTSTLTPEESSELDHYMKLEHLMRLAKARARTLCSQ